MKALTCCKDSGQYTACKYLYLHCLYISWVLAEFLEVAFVILLWLLHVKLTKNNPLGKGTARNSVMNEPSDSDF